MLEYVTYYKNTLILLKKSPHTIKHYSIDAKQFITYLIENKYDFNGDPKEIIQTYKEHLKETFTSTTSINRKLSSLKSFFQFLEARNIVQHVPDEHFQLNKITKNKIQTLSNEQLEEVLSVWFWVYQTASDQEYKWIALRNYCIVRVIVELGIKPAEVVKMNWSHIKNDKMKIFRPKNYRVLTLSNNLLYWLTLYQKETEKVFPTSIYVDHMWLGVGNKQNEAITTKTIERIFQFISNEVDFKVTATTIRYSKINKEVFYKSDEKLDELFKDFGYARKGVLLERIQRF